MEASYQHVLLTIAESCSCRNLTRWVVLRVDKAFSHLPLVCSWLNQYFDDLHLSKHRAYYMLSTRESLNGTASLEECRGVKSNFCRPAAVLGINPVNIRPWR